MYELRVVMRSLFHGSCLPNDNVKPQRAIAMNLSFVENDTEVSE